MRAGVLFAELIYRTEVEASKSVAYVMIGIIINNAQFKQELKAAQVETPPARSLVNSFRLYVPSALLFY
jgi:hypothetical protein